MKGSNNCPHFEIDHLTSASKKFTITLPNNILHNCHTMEKTITNISLRITRCQIVFKHSIYLEKLPTWHERIKTFDTTRMKIKNIMRTGVIRRLFLSGDLHKEI